MNDMTGTFSLAAQLHSAPLEEAEAPGHIVPQQVDEIGFVFQICRQQLADILIDLKSIEALGAAPRPLHRDDRPGRQPGQDAAWGSMWIIANIRSMVLDRRDPSRVVADVDFLGEGNEQFGTGKIINFRRGVTRYPTPGTEIFPVSSADMDQIYAASDTPHVQIGTIYPTSHTRAALYVDAMLGKHFALLGSTGTGKSTSPRRSSCTRSAIFRPKATSS
jgi:hypothetical protein